MDDEYYDFADTLRVADAADAAAAAAADAAAAAAAEQVADAAAAAAAEQVVDTVDATAGLTRAEAVNEARRRAIAALMAQRVVDATRGGYGPPAGAVAVSAELQRRQPRAYSGDGASSAALDAELVCRWRLLRSGQLPAGGDFLYEPQEAYLCAKHAVNNLLYRQVVTEADFASVWRLVPFIELTGEVFAFLSHGQRDLAPGDADSS
jgi:hypothetical protein